MGRRLKPPPASPSMLVNSVALDVPLALRNWISDNSRAVGVNGLNGAGKTT